EFRLPVPSRVFITETSGDLEILFETRSHEELLVLLRGLRKGVESPLLEPRRHDIIARTFGRGFGERRGFDLDKAFLLEEVAHELEHFEAIPEVLLHPRTSQVQVAIAQPDLFIDLFSVRGNVENRRFRLIENCQSHSL